MAISIDSTGGGAQAEAFQAQQFRAEDEPKTSSTSSEFIARDTLVTEQALQESRDSAKADGSEGSGALPPGGDIFAQLAALIGEKLTENLQSLIDKGKAIDASGDKTFEAASSFAGETEKTKVISASLGEVIPAIGESLEKVSKT